MQITYDSPQLDSIMTALSHSKRRGIVHDLSFGPATVSQLAAAHDLSLPAIHKHLATLEEANLIMRRKAGRTNFVALRARTLMVAQQWLGQYRAHWGSDEATLDNYIAKMRE